MDAAGPSRRATVTDEAEELALEAGVAPPPADGAAGAGANGAAEAADGDEGAEDEAAPRETLYLHNLNEKVQVNGASRPSASSRQS